MLRSDWRDHQYRRRDQGGQQSASGGNRGDGGEVIARVVRDGQDNRNGPPGGVLCILAGGQDDSGEDMANEIFNGNVPY